MFGYILVGTKNKKRAGEFYDALLGELGHKRVFDAFNIIGWGESMGSPWFAVCTPFNREEATFGNGAMVAFAVDSEEDVDRLYNKALELGGTCEGEPGMRGGGLYCGYFRDLDGNKFNFHTMGS